MASPILELSNINKSFGHVQANKDITLKINKGTIHGIIGENGAGKSTLMSIVFGLYQADSGTISINGNIIKLKSPRDSIVSGIGMVHQHFMLVENFTVLENIILGFEGEIVFGKKLKQASAKYFLSSLLSITSSLFFISCNLAKNEDNIERSQISLLSEKINKNLQTMISLSAKKTNDEDNRQEVKKKTNNDGGSNEDRAQRTETEGPVGKNDDDDNSICENNEKSQYFFWGVRNRRII